jgi:hypothetical protein
MNNLKQIVERLKSIIFNIRNGGIVESRYNMEEKEIVNEFTKKLKKFNLTDLFKDHDIIIQNLPVNTVPDNIKVELNNNYMNVNIINSLNNSDLKLIFYIIHNFLYLLDNNKNSSGNTIESELAHLIIKLIRFVFNMYYRPYSNYNVRKFDFMLINETPYVDETLKVVGNYMELLTQQEIDDPEKKEKEYDAKEEFDSLDIDDYEKDDDIDGSFEALDGYED